MEILNTFLYFEISLTFFSLTIVTLKLDLGVCTDGTHVSCCSNYYEVNNKCIECQPGKFGINCSQSCLYGFYGALCRSKCDCTTREVCDQKIGCKDQYAYCGEDTCCTNYISVGGVCKACPPGLFGVNCTKHCPNGTYGLFCKEKCTCMTGCDKAIGCIAPDEATGNLEEIIFASVAGFIGIVGLLMAFLAIGRCSKKVRPNIYDQSANLGAEANEEQHDYDALQKNEEYEEALTGRFDNCPEATQQTNNVPNAYIDICG